MKQVYLIADDFGISPGVSKSIANLALNERLSGAGCMVVFDGWDQYAESLESCQPDFQIGLHLTLTDFPWNGQQMPPIMRHIQNALLGKLDKVFLQKACALQLEEFRRRFGKDPDFIDGHQHVHLLPPVRKWIIQTFQHITKKPWVRGVPGLAFSSAVAFSKSSLLRLVGRGHTKALTNAGLEVKTPLLGFYNWSSPNQNFDANMAKWLNSAQNGSVIMCHPGRVDAILESRDIFTTAREFEYQFLASEQFLSALINSKASIKQ